MDSPGWCATRLRVGRRVRVGVVDQVRLGRWERMGVVWLWLRRCWKRVAGQDVAMGVDDLHGVLLVCRRFMMRFKVLVLLVVEATTRFNRAPSAWIRPARWGMMNMSGRDMVGHWKTSGERGLGRRRLWRKMARGGGCWSSLRSGRRWHRFTDYRGVGHMRAGGCRGLRQLSTASTWSTGPRRWGNRTPADWTTALNEKWNKANKKNEPQIPQQNM